MENNTLRLIPEMDMGELEKLVYDSQKVKAELDLLKRVIIRSLALDYSGKELMLSSDKLIIETMRVIEPAILADILESEMDADADRKAKELETIEKQYAITKDEAENILKEDDNG